MRVLGIETSCDETSAAVVRDQQILSNVISSQIDLHAVYGGVVPEVASRQHLRIIDTVLRDALSHADVKPEDLDAVAVTRGPGLPSALLVGVSAARGLALRLRKPLIPVHHMEAHLYSAGMEDQPCVALVVSGGHTMLVHAARFGEHRVLGRTVDDAAGEAFDKAAQMLGLGYPGGPQIEKQARKGDPTAHRFPRPMLESGDWNFSFSGLKTALRRTLSSIGQETGAGRDPVQRTADFCASFQAALVDVLVEKTVRAARAHHVSRVTLSGGVACNGYLRERLEARCRVEGMQVVFADRKLCADNAAMIALLAEKKMERPPPPPAAWDIEPDWALY